MRQEFFPLLFCVVLDPGSEIRDPGRKKNQESGMNSLIRNTVYYCEEPTVPSI
jgi:hypothetical protein